MRILHCVTLVSPTGEFGGPTTVAVNQCRELIRRGHSVELVAGARGYDRLPNQVDDVPALVRGVRAVLPGAGFSGLVSAPLLARVWREVGRADVVHVHLARDLITLPVAVMTLARGRRLIVQAHGMVDASSRRSAAVLDRLAVRRVMRRAAAVLYLSPAELRDLQEVFADEPRYVEVPNGIARVAVAPLPRTTSGALDVVFVGRLADRKRPMMFVEAARVALRRGLDARFTLYGADEGLGDEVRRALAEDDGGGRIRWDGALPAGEVTDRVARADLLLNTTDFDQFPMSVLESISVGTPVVMGVSSPLGRILEAAGAGVSSSETAEDFAEAVVTIGTSEERLESMSRAAIELARSEYTLAAVVDKLEAVYGEAVR